MKQCVILLVEDDSNDAFFIARALTELGFNGHVEHVTATQIARDYLSGAGKYTDREKYPHPDIVVSDSILPGHGSGIELLEWMRKQNFKETPFIILSGEITPDVKQRATSAGVKQLLRKGSNFRETQQALRQALLEMPAECRPWFKG
ncbi:MAG TPA: response regulator [Verrucomicrobiae bacterium]